MPRRRERRENRLIIAFAESTIEEAALAYLATIGWQQLRVLVKRILRRRGYPPDTQEKAPQTILEQAALLPDEWAAA